MSLFWLHRNWTIRQVDGDIHASASVPGCVHTDLLTADLIPDPYLDRNETELGWIGRSTWRYETVFDRPDGSHDRIDLVCEGLDTVARVELNGRVIGATANMHRRYRFDIGPALREGDNELSITFTPAHDYAEGLVRELGERPSAYTEPYTFIRKMACNFGWDWGPALVTAGIWRPIGLHAWSGARLAQVRPQISLTDGGAHVAVHVEVERTTDEELLVTASVAGASAVAAIPAGETVGLIELDVEEPALWWPRGYGEQPRYELVVRTADDEWRQHIGFRDVRLDTAGGAFTLMVNGQPIFVKGANWIPDDCFPSRVDRGRYADRLAQACGAGINLLRVWGGGVYESDDFYDLCDELGLMVWQDFPFACGAYPEEQPIADEVEAEAQDNVVRLMPHPSLVLWCGGNENVWGYFDWGWQERLAGRTWGATYYTRTLPGVLAELDPARPYLPSSPYSGSIGLHPNRQDRGPIHIWDVWNQRDYAAYRQYRPRFVAEFGFQAPAAYATIRRAIHDEPLTPDSPGIIHHQKAVDGNRKLLVGLQPYFPHPETFDDWHYLTQVNQGRAIQLGIEHFRSLWPYCAGSIVWQLNDCWPVTSWAAIDGDGRKKPLFHALRKAYADRLLTVQPREDGLALVVVNDTAETWAEEAQAVRQSLDGRVHEAQMIAFRVPPRGIVTVPLSRPVADTDDPARELIAVTAGDRRALWFHVADKDLDLRPPQYTVQVEGRRVRVTAHTLLRDLALFPDRLDPAAEVDDQLVTLLPGESAVFTLNIDGLDDKALAGFPVLRCVNDVVAG
jgi:beta-mannosidase